MTSPLKTIRPFVIKLHINNPWMVLYQNFSVKYSKNSLIRTPSGLGKMSGLEWIPDWEVFYNSCDNKKIMVQDIERISRS